MLKNVLVTGADGFIGSHLTEMLFKEGYNVKALSLYNSFNDWGWIEEIGCRDEINVLAGDIRDPHFCMEMIADVDLVFHLAALIAIPYSYIAPSSYVDTNITGTLNICQAAKEKGNTRIIHTSTSEVYGTALYVPIDEKHPKQPQSPYSASKIGADAIAMSFHNAFSLPLTVARPFNTYGPRQSARAIIPTIITQIANGLKEIHLGDLTPTRDFNFVTDTCRGFLAIAGCDETIGKEINIATRSEVSILELFQLIKDIMKSDARAITEETRLRPESSEVYRLLGDNGLLERLTGFQTKYDLEKGLRETIEWFTQADNLKKYKSTIYNV